MEEKDEVMMVGSQKMMRRWSAMKPQRKRKILTMYFEPEIMSSANEDLEEPEEKMAEVG
jgi:hypothetical protein